MKQHSTGMTLCIVVNVILCANNGIGKRGWGFKLPLINIQ